MTAKQAKQDASHQSLHRKSIFVGIAVLLSCMAFFGFDVLADIVKHSATPAAYSRVELIHLVFEILAFFGLGFAALTLRTYLKLLQADARKNHETIQILQGHFEEVLRQKFVQWGLTSAERDVTLLVIKGLSIAEIAEARNCAPGTIKAHSTAIFRKIGVKSKTELMSAIIDEFLDSGTVPSAELT